MYMYMMQVFIPSVLCPSTPTLPPDLTCTGLMASDYIVDSTMPTLQSFAIDMNTGIFVLTFSETVNISTFTPTHLTLVDTAAPTPFTRYQLRNNGTLLTDDDSPIVSFRLDDEDLNAIKLDPDLFDALSTSHISLSPYAVIDMSDNLIMALNFSAAIRASDYQFDTRPPALVSYELNLNSSAVTLTFDEAVDHTTLNPSVITLVNLYNNATRSYQIVGERVTQTISSLGLEVTFVLTPDDQDNLKAYEDFATEPNNTFLVVTDGLIRDLSREDNMNQPITVDDPLMASAVLPDLIAPELVEFPLFDLGAGTLQLSFNEPVNASSVLFDRITILAAPGSPHNHSLVNGSAAYVDNTLRKEIEITLSQDSVFSLKMNPDLATGISDTHVLLARGAIQDQGGNEVLPSATFRADDYERDRVGPTVLGFVLDVDEGTLLLSFNDIVDTSTLDINLNIAIQGDSDGRAVDNFVQFTALPNYVATTSPDGFEVLITIPPANLDLIKANDQLATERNNTFLTLTAETIEDLAGNPAIPFVPEAALPATDYIADETSPELVNFDLDIDGTGLLTLTFSEAVIQDNLLVSEVTLVGENNESYSLMSSNFPLNPPLSSFTITLGGILGGATTQDLNAIKSFPNLASLESNTFITISSLAVRDTSGNNVTAISSTPLPVTAGGYTPDRTRPELSSFELDMDLGILTLSFSETVNGSSFNPRAVTLRSSREFSASSHTLSGGYWEPLFRDYIELNLTTDDLNEVKRILDLANAGSTTYISFSEDLVSDMASGVSETDLDSNPIIPLETFEAQLASDYTIDSTSPVLVGFSLNLTTETLELTFDETVDASSLQINLITLQSRPVELEPEDGNETEAQLESGSGFTSGSGFYYGSGSGSGGGLLLEPDPLLATNLTVGSENASSSSSHDGTVITIQLGADDLNSLKLQVGLATDTTNTYISFPENTIHDTSLNVNLVEPVLPEEALQADEFGADFIPPELLRFDLNLTSERLHLTFSEVVNASTIDLTAITLQGAFTAGQGSLADVWSLTEGTNGSTASPEDGTEVTVYLGWTDLNEIKRLTGVATETSNSYITLTSEAVRDMNGNAVIPRVDGESSLPVAFFTEDNVSPELVVFNVDMNSGLLTLEFSETARAASINVTQITLLSSRNESDYQMYTLMPDSSTPSSDNTTITISLSRDDQNAIKFRTDLAQDQNSTFLSITHLAATDMNSNPVLPIPLHASLPVSTFISDTTGPKLNSFDLNLTAETLTLHFEETVNISSLQYSRLTLQPSPSLLAVNYTLRTGMILGENTPDVVIQLDFDDLNRLKLDPSVATSGGNTYLYMRDGAVLDLALSANRAVEDTIPVSLFSEDETNPNLVAFSANLNVGTLTLNFDEPVNASTFDPTGITLTSTMGGGSALSLTGGNTTSSNGLQIVVHFSDDDLNEIKVQESLYTDEDNVFISLQPSTIADMNGNPVNALLPSDSLNATSFVNDTTSPRLLAFDLDFDSDILTLEFVETVNTSSINFTGITLQPASNSSNTYTLTGGNLLSLDDSTVVQFELLRVDSDEIKAREIALTQNTTWLMLERFTISDQNDQPLLPLLNGINATAVRNYTQDDTQPSLDRFHLNLTDNTLTLEFSETVNVIDTLTVSALTLLAGPNADLIGRFHVLGLDGNTLSTDVYTPVVTVQLGRLDLNELKRMINLATSEADTYLALDSTAISDMKLNPVVAITTVNPRQGNFTEDRVPPELERFDLDMNASSMVLYFSETVDPTTLDMTQFLLQFAGNVSADSAHVHRFTGGVASTADPTPSFTVTINTPDLNDIKRLPLLATSEENAFMRLHRAGLQDMNRNYITALSHDQALKVENYTMDEIRPLLVSFDLNLSSERLILTFSETVNSSSLDPTGIVVQGSRSASLPDVRRLEGGSVLTPFDTVVEIQLDASDLNYIKSVPGLASSEDDTYLSLDDYTIEDMFQNLVVGVESSAAEQVRNYTDDDRSPVLISFDLDMDEGTIDLTFNETVYVPSLTVGEITIQNDVNVSMDTTRHVFSPEANTSSASPDWPVITISIGAEDLNEIKRLSDLSISPETTFLNLTSLAIADTNSNQLTPTTLPVSNFTEDTTDPELTSFTFDLDSGQLEFIFSETVNVSSLDPTQVTLQNVRSATDPALSSLTLMGGDVLIVGDNTTVTVRLLKPDLDTLKALPIATDVDTTYLSVTSDLILDMNNNSLVSIPNQSARMAQGFTNDTTSPRLEEYSIDMNTGVLMLTFSETVDTATLNLTQLTLQDTATATSTFTLLSSVHSRELQPVVTVYISKRDLDLLKENRAVGTGRDDTFLTLTNLTVLDTAGNSVVPIPDGSGMQVENYTADITAPQLEAFDFDVDSGLLTLSYSETIDILSFNHTQVILQGHRNLSLSLHSFTLRTGYLLPNDSTVAYFTLSVEDLNEVKRLVHLATCTGDDTYLSLIPDQNATDSYLEVPGVSDIIMMSLDLESNSSGSGESGSGMGMGQSGSGMETRPTAPLLFSSHIYDMFGNPVVLVWNQDALLVSECVNDTTPPWLVNFTLNMHNSTLTLTFDETVNTTSLDTRQITLYSGTLNATDTSNGTDVESYQLTSSYTSIGTLSGQVVVELTISNADLNEIKRRSRLATRDENTRISVSQYLILDMNRNQNVEIPPEDALLAESHIPDERPPVLLLFELDLTADTLTLSFSETVNASSLTVGGITILNENNTSNRTLVGGNFVIHDPLNRPDDPIIVIKLDEADLNYIKSVRDLATSQNDTFLSIEDFAIADMNGNLVEPINTSLAQRASGYTEDEVSPELVSFDLNIDSFELFLTFTETVDVLTLNVSAISLQPSSSSSPSEQFSFTAGNTSDVTFSTSRDWPEIVINIGVDDMNEIKRRTDLATSNITTYLTLRPHAILDMNGNEVVPIANDNATQVTNYTEDTTNPQLVEFSLDLNLGSLHLTFNETVNFTSTNFTQLTLLSGRGPNITATVPLSGGAITNTLDSTVVDIILTVDDLNTLKRIRSIATSVADTYLSVEEGAVWDMNDNPVDAIPPYSAVMATNVTEDVSHPHLVDFDLDTDLGTLTLTFNETVEASSLNVSQITLQDQPTATGPSTMYTLTGGVSSMEDSIIITINFTFFDLNEIKKLRDLASNESGSDSFITLTNLTIVDMNDNPVVPIPDGTGMGVRNFTQDTTPPELVSFDLDMNIGLLVLNFSETVDTLTFNITQYSLQGTANVSGALTDQFSLTEEDLLTGDEVIIEQNLLYFDLNTIKSLGLLATSPNDTYLSLTGSAIRDMVGNAVVEISSSSGLLVSNYTADINRPLLESFDLNMDEGTLDLTFSETVNITTLDVTEVTLFSHEVNASQSFSFSVESTSDDRDWPYFTIDIGLNDLNTIKARDLLATRNETTFIQLSEYVIRDTAGNMNLATNVTMVMIYTPDTTDPALLEFDLDLTRDILTLRFNETVDVATFDPTQLTLSSAWVHDGSGSGQSGSGSGQSGSGMESGMTEVVNYTLTSGELLSTVNSTRLQLALSFRDRNELKRLLDLAISNDTTFLSLTSSLVRDTASNPVQPISISDALPVTNYTGDSAQPRLLHFDLDMDGPTLTLFLSETVEVSSLSVSAITLQSTGVLVDGETESHTLTPGPAPLGTGSMSGDGPTVVIDIGEDDANAIKFLTQLAQEDNSTFLSFTPYALEDTNGNQIVEVLESNATQVNLYLRDDTGPVLRNFSLNLTSERLSLTFDETVDFSSLSAMLVTIHRSMSDPDPYRLQAAVPIGLNSPVLVLNLTATQYDLNQLKLRPELAVDEESTYILLQDGTIFDLASLPNAIISSPLTPVDEFFPDQTPPDLISFTANINAGTLTLVFSEVVNVSSLDPTALRLQNSSNGSGSYLQLSGESPGMWQAHACTYMYMHMCIRMM